MKVFPTKVLQIALLSNTSFTQGDSKLGAQFIAEEFVALGHEVDYFAVPSAPCDFLSPSRRTLWKRAWSWGGDTEPYNVQPGLHEYFIRAPFGRSRKRWWHRKQVRWYASWLPHVVRNKQYDVVITDTAMTFLFINKFRAKVKVLRLNDNPDGFTGFIHPWVVQTLKQWIAAGVFNQVWPTNDALASWARALHNEIPIRTFPNGIPLTLFASEPTTHRRPKSAVYVGRFNSWFDFDLLNQCAALLPNWTFDLFGQRPSSPIELPHNVRLLGPVEFNQIPKLLRDYEVGLIPFAGNSAVLDHIDPLKWKQYMAAECAVAMTDHGRLGSYQNGLTFHGNTPETFADAVVRAGEAARAIDDDVRTEVRRKLEEQSWESIVRTMESCIHAQGL